MCTKETWPPRSFKRFARDAEHAQPGGADELQPHQVEHQVFHLTVEHRRKSALQLRRGGGVEAAGQFHRGGVLARRMQRILDLDIEWHLPCSLLETDPP
jgi:hypothetical protein